MLVSLHQPFVSGSLFEASIPRYVLFPGNASLRCSPPSTRLLLSWRLKFMDASLDRTGRATLAANGLCCDLLSLGVKLCNCAVTVLEFGFRNSDALLQVCPRLGCIFESWNDNLRCGDVWELDGGPSPHYWSGDSIVLLSSSLIVSPDG